MLAGCMGPGETFTTALPVTLLRVYLMYHLPAQGQLAHCRMVPRW